MMNFCLAVVLMLAPFVAEAQMLVKPIDALGERATHASGIFMVSEIDYESKGNSTSDSEIERKLLGVELAYGISPTFDIVGQVALIMDSEISGSSTLEDGEGFNLGGGVRGVFWRHGNLKVGGFGNLIYQTESFEGSVASVSYEAELTMLEMHLGGGVLFDLNQTVQPYAVLDLVAYDDGDSETKVGTYSADGSFERDDMMCLKLGIEISLEDLDIRPELTILGEQTFAIAVGASF